MASDLPFEPTAAARRPRRRRGHGVVAALRAVLRWSRDRFAEERDRHVLWLPVGFAAGAGAFFALRADPVDIAGAPLGAVLVGALAGAWLILRAAPAADAARAMVAVLAVAAAGFLAAQWRTDRVAAPILDGRYGPAPVVGRVVTVESRPGGQRVVLDTVRLLGLEEDATPARVRFTLADRLGAVRLGERVRVRVELRPPPWPPAPGAFDFQRHAFFQGIGGVGYAVGRVELAFDEPGSEAGGDWRLWLDAVRAQVTMRVQAALPDETGAVAAALITGERRAIPEPVLEAMRDAGLAHLLAISGLHIGLVAGLIFFAVRGALALVERVALRWPIKKIAALAALLGALVYLMLAGATIPTQRAFMMTGLVLAAVLLDRTAISLNLVAWAALVVLALAPDALLGPSFQMSFAAVVALVAFYEAFRPRLTHMSDDQAPERRLAGRVALYLLGIALTTLIATAATSVFAVYHFNRLATYGIVANLVAVPLTAFWIMPCAVLAGVLMPFGLESLGLIPMGWGIGALIAVAETAAAWPHAVKLVPAMPTVGLVAFALGGLWLCLWRGHMRWAGLVPCVLAVASIAMARGPDLLVSGDGRLLAVRGADGALALSSRRTARLTGEIWLRRNGQAAAAPWPRDGDVSGDRRLACDRLACRYTGQTGSVVAMVRDPRALAEDCRASDLVVSAVPVRRRCPGARAVVDRFDLWREGPHAVWFGDGGSGFAVRSVRDWRGDRPWTPRRAPGARSANR